MHECASIAVTNLRVANTHAHLIDFETWQKKFAAVPQRIATRIRRYLLEYSKNEKKSSRRTPLHCPHSLSRLERVGHRPRVGAVSDAHERRTKGCAPLVCVREGSLREGGCENRRSHEPNPSSSTTFSYS